MNVSKGLLLAVPCKLCFYLSNKSLAKSLYPCSLLPSFPPETSQPPALVSGLCRDTISWSAPHKCLFHSIWRTSPAWILPLSPPTAPTFTSQVLEMPLTSQNLQNYCFTAFFTQLYPSRIANIYLTASSTLHPFQIQLKAHFLPCLWFLNYIHSSFQNINSETWQGNY